MPIPVLLSDPRMVVFNTSSEVQYIEYRATVSVVMNQTPYNMEFRDVVSFFMVGDTYLIVSLDKCYDPNGEAVEIGDGSPISEHYIPIHNVVSLQLDYTRSTDMVEAIVASAALGQISEGGEEDAM